MTRQQRPTLSGRTWGKTKSLQEVRKDSKHGYEGARFQAYQFDDSLGTRTRRDFTLSPVAYAVAYGDRSMDRHVEILLTGCWGHPVESWEVPAEWAW